MTLKVVIFAFKDSGKFEKNYSVHNKTIPYFYTLKAQCTQLYLLRSACLNIILNVDNPIFQRCKSTNIGPRERFGLGSCGRSVGDLRQHVWSTDDARWAVSYQEWLRVRLTCGFWLVTHILRIQEISRFVHVLLIVGGPGAPGGYFDSHEPRYFDSHKTISYIEVLRSKSY